MPAADVMLLKCPSAVHLNLLGFHHYLSDLGPRPMSDLPLLVLAEDLQSLQCKDLLDEYPADVFCENLSYCLQRWTQITCLELTGSLGGIDVKNCQHPLPQLPHLQRLAINTLLDCDLTTDGLGGLVQCSTLTYVQLTGCLEEFDVQVNPEKRCSREQAFSARAVVTWLRHPGLQRVQASCGMCALCCVLLLPCRCCHSCQACKT